jgi:23S rRNA (uridine2552-2'-O)-methyltransferase
MVGVGTMNLALGRSKLNLRHGRIIKAKMKTRTQSKKVNKAWLNDHVNDTYVKLAQKEGYRARAAYKLKEIDEMFGLIRPGQVVVDLGSAPGAWSQYLRRKLSPRTATGGGAASGELNGTIIAMDILPMEPVEGVSFLQGDFREPEMLVRLEGALEGRQADVVVSDMAPNLSGIDSADAARIVHLVELAVDFSKAHLKAEGALVVKLFHGGGYDELVKLFKATFRVVKPVKPKASRDKSSETFLVGRGLKSTQAS